MKGPPFIYAVLKSLSLSPVYYMKRKIKSGNVIEVTQFPVGDRKPRADRRKGSSTLKKIDQNLRDAVKRLARILNCNVQPGWLFIVLTYDDKHLPQDPAEAEKQSQLFIRRAERKGFKVKGVWVTADKDKEGNTKRLHHHIICDGEGLSLEYAAGKLSRILCGKAELKDIWKNGFVYVDPIQHDDDYSRIAAYLVRQAVSGTDVKKWHTSRGLKKPEIIEEVITDRPTILRAPGGAEVKESAAYSEDYGVGYIRYIRPPRKPRKKPQMNNSGGGAHDRQGV